MKPGREKKSNLFSYRSSFDSLFRVAKCTDGFHFFLYLCTQAVRNYFFSKEITKNKITSHGDIEPDFDFPLRWANRHDHNDGVVRLPLQQGIVFSNWLATGGTATLTFTIAAGNYPEGYTPPVPVTITIKPLGTWAVTASVVVINGGAAQTVSVMPSASPTKVITLTPTSYSPTFLTWASGDAAAKTISVTTTSPTASINVVTLTPTGSAVAEFVTSTTFSVIIDGPKTSPAPTPVPILQPPFIFCSNVVSAPNTLFIDDAMCRGCINATSFPFYCEVSHINVTYCRCADVARIPVTPDAELLPELGRGYTQPDIHHVDVCIASPAGHCLQQLARNWRHPPTCGTLPVAPHKTNR